MIVVTGATGNVGRPLVRALAAAGEEVTAVSRRPADSPEGVRHLAADLDDPGGLAPAFDGAGALFLLAAGGDPEGIIEVAKAGGVKRVVVLSSLGAGTRPELYPHFVAYEEAVRRSGLDWTLLRPGGFDSNAFLWAESVRAERLVAAPFPEVALPMIDPDDIGEVAAAVLRDGRHTGRTYELTGPSAISPRQQARAIGDALGEPVRFAEQSRDEARARLLGFMPEPIVEATLTVTGEPTPRERQVSPDVERILGRAPRAFAGWAARNAGAFR